jgi:CTP:molybdopterin cytidylyltransferase MocA
VQAVLRGLDVVTSPNREPAAGLSGSVATALERLGDVEALLLCPVDMPFVDASLVHALATALVEPARAAVPVVDDALGHPALFHRSLFAALREAGPRGGPRAVLAATTVARVPWSDARVLADLNTPAAFEAAFSRP